MFFQAKGMVAEGYGDFFRIPETTRDCLRHWLQGCPDYGSGYASSWGNYRQRCGQKANSSVRILPGPSPAVVSPARIPALFLGGKGEGGFPVGTGIMQ